MKVLTRLAFVMILVGLQGTAHASVPSSLRFHLTTLSSGTLPNLTCTKAADVTTVSNYPATVNYTLTFTCVYFDNCTSDDLVDSLYGTLASQGTPLVFSNSTPTEVKYSYDISSYEACAAAAGVPPAGSVELPNVVTGSVLAGGPWPIAGCQAKVTCNPPTTGGPTRTLGFFKTHVDALASCVGMGSINLGFGTVTNLGQALWLLWADPSNFTAVAKARLLLGRQVLVAECNDRLFDTEFGDMSDAITLLSGTRCAAMKAMASDVDTFNNSGDLIAFPSGFQPGSADPGLAQSLIGSFSIPNGTCTP